MLIQGLKSWNIFVKSVWTAFCAKSYLFMDLRQQRIASKDWENTEKHT